MEVNGLQELADLVKAGRLQKNYTQQQLAERCGLSLRSVQRIESAEVCPRNYTRQVLAAHLEINLDPQRPVALKAGLINSRSQQYIVSAGLAGLMTLLALAYVFQSPTFPETAFEATLYAAVWLFAYVVLMLLVWRNK